ncbi:MAG: hypothetical protein ACFE0Q_01795 [Anaerolineae bacterium]
MGQETGNIGFSARRVEHDIHEFVWTSPSREAVDVWLEYNESLYQVSDLTDTLCFIHIVQTMNFPPLSYVVRKARELQMKYPQHSKTRSAILFQSKFFGGFINTMSQLLNRVDEDQTRFFGIDERDQAIAWLLDEH